MRIIPIYISILVIGCIIATLGGCVTYNECISYPEGSLEYKDCVAEAREYRRVEYIETTLKPQLYACEAARGFPIWQFTSMRTKRAVDKGNLDGLSRMDAQDYKGCCTQSISECFGLRY